jgi:hypothetical protein
MAIAQAAGPVVHSVATASADGTANSATAGNAVAGAIGNGASGTAAATASAYTMTDTQIDRATSSAIAIVSTSATAVAGVVQDGDAISFINDLTSVSVGESGPGTNSSAVTGLFSQNNAIATSFGADATIVSLGEVGGGHATSGTDTEISVATQDIHVSLAKSVAPGDLVLGLADGQTVGSGVTDVNLSVHVKTPAFGATVLTLNFAGPDAAAEAQAAFTDQTYDLGNWLGTVTADFTMTLSVTTDQANAGFFGNFIVGNVPSADAAAQRFDFVPHLGHAWDFPLFASHDAHVF